MICPEKLALSSIVQSEFILSYFSARPTGPAWYTVLGLDPNLPNSIGPNDQTSLENSSQTFFL